MPLPSSEFSVSDVPTLTPVFSQLPSLPKTLDQTSPCWASSNGYSPRWSSFPAGSSGPLDLYGYYPPMSSIGGARLWDDFLEDAGLYLRLHPDALDDRPSATFGRNVGAHPSRPSVIGSTGKTEVPAYPKSSNMIFDPEPGFAFAMNTSSMGDSTSWSMDSMHYQRPPTCPSKTGCTSTSTNVCPSEYNGMPRNDYWSVHNSGRFKHCDHADPLLTSWPISYPYSGAKDFIAGKNAANSAVPHNGVTNPSPIDGGFSLGNETSAGNSMRGCGKVDRHRITVDLPPRKGVSTSQQFPSTCSATVAIHDVIKEKKNFSELGQFRSYLSTGVHSKPMPSPKQEGSLFGKGNSQSSPSSRPDSSTPAELQNANRKANEMLGSSSNCSEKENQCSSLPGEQRTAPMSIQREAEIVDLNAKVVVQEGNPAAENLPVCLDRTADTEAGVTSSVAESPSDFNSCANELVSGDPLSGKNVNLFVKTMHGLSDVLLSSCNIGGIELKEDDHKLLQLVIENLEAFIRNHKKANSDDSQLDASPSNVAIPEVDGMNSSKKISSCNVPKKMNYTSSTLDDSEFENLITSLNEEVASISLKYQLALAELKEKLEKKAKAEVCASENYDQAKACPPSSSNAPKHASDGAVAASKESPDATGIQTCATSKQAKQDEVDASIRARYNILKRGMGKLDAASIEQKTDFVKSAYLYGDIEKKSGDCSGHSRIADSAMLKKTHLKFATMWQKNQQADCIESRWSGTDASDGELGASKELPVDAPVIHTDETNTQAEKSDAGDSDWELLVEDDFTLV